MGNLFQYDQLPTGTEELFETLLSTKGVTIERIVSNGQITPENSWYDQDHLEWVCLLQGDAQILYDTDELHALSSGDFLLIPAHQKHRVVYTSQDPPCVWLAIHLNNTLKA